MPLMWIGIYLTIGGLVLLAPSRRAGGRSHKHSRNELILRTLSRGRAVRSGSQNSAGSPAGL